MRLTFLADKDIPFLDDFMPDGISVVRFDPLEPWEKIEESIRNSCTAILIRTVSPINSKHFNPDLFPKLSCIGTASAGYDHVDTDFLSSNGIHFFDAGGANAQAVGEYVASVIVQWSIDYSKQLDSIIVGLIGAGHTGSKAGSILKELGCKVVYHDPPKERRDPSFISADIRSILACDVISFHVPYDLKSAFPTRYWLDAQKLESFQGKLVINAARGGVIDEYALLNWYRSNKIDRRFVLDVWENEPELKFEMAKTAWLATPHIAGYSSQSKRNTTRMVLKSVCNFLNVSNYIPDSCVSMMNMDAYENWHPLFELSDRLKGGLTEDSFANATHFRALRQHSKLRNEFKFTPIGKFEKLFAFPKVQLLINVCGGPI